MFRPDNPLLPNWKHVPIGYHGRASSIVVSGTPIRRPMGQTCPTDGQPPVFGPSKLVDYELEVGFVIGPGNEMGTRIAVDEARQHLFGVCLVNDWSARDVQKWEYQPLGPFNAKNFGTSVSPFIYPLEALEAILVPPPRRPAGDPTPLPYLEGAKDFTLDIRLEVLISSAAMREKDMAPTLVSTASMKEHLYWTPSQMIAHHTSTGCNLRPGDLLASGTVSGPKEEERGCLLERTWRGERPITLADGTTRKFLQDGDEVIMRGWCERADGTRMSIGEVRGVVTAAE
jgi:fumarylacetoacetase